METAVDIFSKMQYGIGFLAIVWLIVLWLRPKVIALRHAVAMKAIAAQKSVAELAASSEPSIRPVMSATRE